jgi:hypothetical protein
MTTPRSAGSALTGLSARMVATPPAWSICPSTTWTDAIGCRRRAEPRSLPGRNDLVVFVHQDVFPHSLAAVIRAAGQTRVGGLGVLGAVGVRRLGLRGVTDIPLTHNSLTANLARLDASAVRTFPGKQTIRDCLDEGCRLPLS